MSELLRAVLEGDEKADLLQFLGQLRTASERYFLRNQILKAFEDYCHTYEKPAYFFHATPMGELIRYTHEIILEEESSWFILRPKIASQEVYRLTSDLTTIDLMPVQALLELHDRIISRDTAYPSSSGSVLEIDFHPFYESSPTIRDPRNIGKGIEFLHRYLSSQLFAPSTAGRDNILPQPGLAALLDILRSLKYHNTQLLVSDRIQSTTELSKQVKLALNFVSSRPGDEPYQTFRFKLQSMGFEPGWGNTASRVRETLELLDRLIDSPDHAVLETFISHIPLIFRIVLVSVHGWVGQEDILGRPQAAGQVVYVLDQARSLEKQLQEDLKLAGLDGLGIQPKVIILTRLIPNSEGTLSHQRLEKVQGTENAWILRVPFGEFNPKVTQNWISRFEIWPYLESFAQKAERELLAEFEGRPDLIVGNYSDGNLVAFLLARRFKVTQCSISHVLEKPRYLFSNLYWQDLEHDYHFSLQFMADLIGMNSADFILTSTYQAIVGTPEQLGFYESYKYFTMPNLYHVVDGIDLFNPKFNVVPPGVNESIFFPYNQMPELRVERDLIKEILLTREDPQIIGTLDEPNKRPILAMATLYPSKNLTGLAECFGKSQQLQQYCNLILVTGRVRLEEAKDAEERGEIEKLYQIIDQYNLKGKIRWIGLHLSTPETAEIYRVIADCGGIFVQPARFEAFGLMILEAMISGLPTFATQFGGPSEIIQDGTNGFHINPTDFEGTAQKIIEFIARCEQEPNYWHEISDHGIKRIRDKYNWKTHTKQLLGLAKIYRFWNYSSLNNREPLMRYLEALFHLGYKPRTEQLLQQHMQW
ncbi:MAG TPA: sucrose synthase [Cyanobacteria bacterium UBA12227]|nr:sucrose synthase [Cyanobacteria bacterium UBA12227]HAX88907.1 sucrose synthase [Cyanobacteria bacterium UBA11370]HBY77747.1 sucrose synthase [Cyanobacteria bacterium UBA11148]